MKYKLIKPLPGIEVGTIYDEVKDITLATTMDKVRLSKFVDLFGTDNDFFEPVNQESKPEKFNYQDELIAGLDGFVSRYSKYNPKKSDISKVLPELVKASFRVPPFAGTCTCCGEPTEPKYTLCKKHYNSWLSSKGTRANYGWLVNIDSPKEVRDWYNIGNLFINTGECKLCGDNIQSLNTHDYQKCKCGLSFIDGGSWYQRSNPELINKSIMFSDLSVE